MPLNSQEPAWPKSFSGGGTDSLGASPSQALLTSLSPSQGPAYGLDCYRTALLPTPPPACVCM